MYGLTALDGAIGARTGPGHCNKREDCHMRDHSRAWFAALAASSLLVAAPMRAQQPLESLRPRLDALAAAHRGVVGYEIVDLTTGDSIQRLGAERFPTASMIKLGVLAELFRQIHDGRVRMADTVVMRARDVEPGSGVIQYFDAPLTLTVHDAAYLMVAHSDNTASNLLIDVVGLGAVNARLDSLGLHRTRLYRKLFAADSTSFAPDSAARYGVGVTTPDEMTRLVAAIYHGRLVSPAASKRMAGVMKQQTVRTMIPRDLPADVPVANKTGSENAVRNDCGVVYAPHPFAMCVFTGENADHSWTLHNHAEMLIGTMARMVYDALNGAAP